MQNTWKKISKKLMHLSQYTLKNFSDHKQIMNIALMAVFGVLCYFFLYQSSVYFLTIRAITVAKDAYYMSTTIGLTASWCFWAGLHLIYKSLFYIVPGALLVLNTKERPEPSQQEKDAYNQAMADYKKEIDPLGDNEGRLPEQLAPSRLNEARVSVFSYAAQWVFAKGDKRKEIPTFENQIQSLIPAEADLAEADQFFMNQLKINATLIKNFVRSCQMFLQSFHFEFPNIPKYLMLPFRILMLPFRILMLPFRILMLPFHILMSAFRIGYNWKGYATGVITFITSERASIYLPRILRICQEAGVNLALRIQNNTTIFLSSAYQKIQKLRSCKEAVVNLAVRIKDNTTIFLTNGRQKIQDLSQAYTHDADTRNETMQNNLEDLNNSPSSSYLMSIAYYCKKASLTLQFHAIKIAYIVKFCCHVIYTCIGHGINSAIQLTITQVGAIAAPIYLRIGYLCDKAIEIYDLARDFIMGQATFLQAEIGLALLAVGLLIATGGALSLISFTLLRVSIVLACSMTSSMSMAYLNTFGILSTIVGVGMGYLFLDSLENYVNSVMAYNALFPQRDMTSDLNDPEIQVPKFFRTQHSDISVAKTGVDFSAISKTIKTTVSPLLFSQPRDAIPYIANIVHGAVSLPGHKSALTYVCPMSDELIVDSTDNSSNNSLELELDLDSVRTDCESMAENPVGTLVSAVLGKSLASTATEYVIKTLINRPPLTT